MTAIDRAHLEQQTSGDPRLAADVLILFRDRVAPLVRDGLPAAERDRMLHAVRGAALGIGATALADAAARFELGAEAEEGQAWSQFRKALAATLAEIAEILAGPINPPQPEAP